MDLHELLRVRAGDDSLSSSGSGLIETGDHVAVTGPTSRNLDRDSHERRGIFRGLSATHGYAIVDTYDGGTPSVILVHPESLERRGPSRDDIAEAVRRLTEEFGAMGVKIDTPPGPAPVVKRRRRIYASSTPLKGMKKVGQLSGLDHGSLQALETELRMKGIRYVLTGHGPMLRSVLWVQADRHGEAYGIYRGYVR